MNYVCTECGQPLERPRKVKTRYPWKCDKCQVKLKSEYAKRKRKMERKVQKGVATWKANRLEWKRKLAYQDLDLFFQIHAQKCGLDHYVL